METMSPVQQAEKNLKEAQRLLDEAVKAQQRGDVQQARVDQLTRLRDAAAEDVIRTRREA
jgi:hypothetical protein